MKRYLNILFLLVLVVFGACSEQEHEHPEGITYTCPMHPEVVRDEPGSCPVCGMDLVPQTVADAKTEVTDELAYLLQPTNETVISDVKTITPEMKAVPDSVEMEGLITYDERRIYAIPARVGGRIEKLFVKYNYQPIAKGQKLLEVYSPELVTAQKELLYLVKSAPEDKLLIEAAKQKLRLLGATDDQLNRIIRSGEASYTFAIYSPYDGYVIGLNTTAPSAIPSTTPVTAANAGGMGGMGGTSSPSVANAGTATPAPGSALQLREGMYISTGQPLLRVVNPNQLWAEFNIPAGQATAIAKGTPVQISFPQLPGEQLEAQVDFLQPFYEAGENFAKIRAYLPGQQKIARVGQLVSGIATYTTAAALWVPREAVLDAGTRSVVFQYANGVFKPTAVTIGNTSGKQVQVLEGLTPDTRIAANAQFMIDSESFVRINE